MKVDKNVMVTMKDGIKLATDIYFPSSEKEKTFPVLINRTPYNKDRVLNLKEINAYINAGYAVVIQDVRGRYNSEGVFIPYGYETEDGLKLFNWVRKQTWNNGIFWYFWFIISWWNTMVTSNKKSRWS